MITIAAKLPWPVGVVLAPLVFVALGFLADIESPAVDLPGNVGGVVAHQFVTLVAKIFQWLIPLLLLIGSAASAIKQRQRARLYANVGAAESPVALNRMSWQDFERLVSDYFQRRGFQVTETGGSRPDGGVDLIARRGNDEYVVQCKQWKAYRVGVVPVRELNGVVSAWRAAGGFVVTSGSFTEEAIQFASGISIELIDGAKLASAITRQGRLQAAAERMMGDGDFVERKAPRCPKCQAEMVVRTARQGPQAGAKFWGCARFPACRGTRPTT